MSKGGNILTVLKQGHNQPIVVQKNGVIRVKRQSNNRKNNNILVILKDSK
jgi:exosome complex RNA-binding protein Rrp4